MAIYGVHRTCWGSIGEIELLTSHLDSAEDHAKAQSAQWACGAIVVSSRELDNAGAVWVISVWQNGHKITDHGPRGEWRRVKHSPI